MAPSPIETLPSELLQEVFILSQLNLAFPESSPYIGRKLSDPYIYRYICNIYFDCGYHPNIYGPCPRNGRCRNGVRVRQDQARIFAYRWMTWDLYKSFVLKKYEPSGCLCSKSPPHCPSPQWPPDFEHPTTMVFEGTHKPDLCSLEWTIPDKLVRGSWTPDKLQFLRFLLWTTAMNIEWKNQEACENTRRGRRDAVLERNFEAVQLLNNCRRVCRAPKLEDVRFAVIEGGCDRSIVYDTMEAARMWGLFGKAWECDILDQWCATAINTGNPKGQWLKLKLQELRRGEPKYPVRIPHVKQSCMSPRRGDYDDVEDDKLIVVPKPWNGPWPRLSYVLELAGGYSPVRYLQ